MKTCGKCDKLDCIMAFATLPPLYRCIITGECHSLDHVCDVESECKSDTVNHPEHYTQGGIECIDAIKAATVGLEGIEAVCTGNAIKYLWRWKRKDGAQDVRKAITYCERLLKEIENESEEKES